MKLWKEKKTKKAWVHIRRLIGTNSSSPIVEGLIYENGVTHFDDATKFTMMLFHMKTMFQK
jgi:hypothetical protein